ncbi:MAG: adenylyltransferase/cytidyltransferase family protein [Gammaproteobacteria bacterium]|nr:adenylyltransferase/cytidyltransferase family protein [Gammaproteobacteria bacterium]
MTELLEERISETTEITHYLSKIVSFEEFLNKISANRAYKQISHCHGVFDLLHIGHIKHLNEAKLFADMLVVSITPDRFVNKGAGRPCFTEKLRAEALASLSCVDYVIVNDEPTAVNAIKTIKPDFYVKGIEYQTVSNDITGKITEEEEAVRGVGGKLRFTDDIVFSSSALINKFFSPYSKEVNLYLDNFKKKFKGYEVLQYLENAKNLKVLLIGEAIIDIYHYGEAIGKAGKEPILVTKYHREEMYAGGALAVANHLSSFCGKITCVTMLGEKGEYESFVNEKTNHNVEMKLFYKQGAPTIVKRRYLEEYTSQKLFEIYEIEDGYLEEEQKKLFLNEVKKLMDEHDVILVADYGHGLLDGEFAQMVSESGKFLAVNTQSNASNHGFNCISKYKRADYVCIAMRELQLNYRQRHISVMDQINHLASDFDYKNITITSGRTGSYVYSRGEEVCETPAFAREIKDRVGAGDAVLAITSLCVAQGSPPEIVGLVGNVVGAEAVNVMGNERYIDKTSLMKHISHLLK